MIFYPRSNTQDSFIIKEVYEDNCYRLPDDLSGITIIDIGSNIGAFVAACVERGAERVIAFEPDPRNHDRLSRWREQLSKEGKSKVECFRNAIVGKFPIIRFLSNPSYLGDIVLTGGLNLFSTESDGYKVDCVEIDRIIPFSGTIWIKIDCEGTEHEIVDALVASPELCQNVEMIFGEVHTTDDNGRLCSIGQRISVNLPSHEEFKSKLEALGYWVEMITNSGDSCLALFWGKKVKLNTLKEDQFS